MPRKSLANFRPKADPPLAEPKRILMFQKPITKFTSKSGKEVEIIEPSIERLPQLLEFVNRLVAEDTFLSLTGNPKTLEEERLWLKSCIEDMKTKKLHLVFAVHNGKIIGQCDIRRGGTRDFHVGTIGLMIDQDFRGEGIGKFLIEYILEQAKKMEGLKIVKLFIFDDNEIAKSLYTKLGFKEFARLPKGFYRKGKFSDALQMYKEISSSFASSDAKAMEDKKATEDK